MPVIPATQEAEARESSLEPRRRSCSEPRSRQCTPAWATEQDSVSKKNIYIYIYVHIYGKKNSTKFQKAKLKFAVLQVLH